VVPVDCPIGLCRLVLRNRGQLFRENFGKTGSQPVSNR
jgi:hypothetical protein